MTVVTIRNVPDDVHDELAARAARSGRSLQEYLLAELSAVASRPSVDDVIVRARSRSLASRMTRAQILDARDADRR